MIEWLIDEMKEWIDGSMEVIRWTISGMVNNMGRSYII